MKNRIAFPFSKYFLFGTLLGIIITTALAFKVFKERPGCAIALHKLNVFYIGVDNPVSIVTRGVPEEQILVEAKGVELKKQGEGSHYIVRAMEQGEASITVSGGDLEPVTFKYRVKKIPPPIPLLGARYRSGTIGSGEFKAQGGIAAVLMNYDFEAKCDVMGYEVNFIRKDADPVTVINTGARYTAAARKLIDLAAPGTSYFFNDIKARCPGDQVARHLGSLAFKIR